MLGKYIFFFLIICVISQAKCKNLRNVEDNIVPQSFLGDIFRRTAELKRQFATTIDKIIFFNRVKNVFDKNDQDNEADDMIVKPEVEVSTNRLFPMQNYNGRSISQNYNGRPIRSEFIYKLINELCAEGRNIPGICN
ncbi:uncharacterized protein LOC141534243 [Cotesia typhae]|uniref:uncharacterized protein LOC141534243 n=1 Tax=Cotesia typhae TaxID=2053667 RepID=UPI003D68EE72